MFRIGQGFDVHQLTEGRPSSSAELKFLMKEVARTFRC